MKNQEVKLLQHDDGTYDVIVNGVFYAISTSLDRARMVFKQIGVDPPQPERE